MTINLEKDQKIKLDKDGTGQKKFRVGLGWDVKPGADADLDVSAICCKYDAQGNPKIIANPGFVFYNNLSTPCGGVVHSGDNRTGAGEGDDEVISLDLAKLGTSKELDDIDEVSFIVTIHEGKQKNVTFGAVKNAHAHIYEGDSQTPLAKFYPSDDFSTDTAIQLGSVYKGKDGEWRWASVAAGLGKADLTDILRNYGAQI